MDRTTHGSTDRTTATPSDAGDAGGNGGDRRNTALAPDTQRAIELLVCSQDGDECVLGRADLGIFVAVPPPGLIFVRTLQDGGSVGEAAERAGEAAGAAVDAEDFLADLDSAGLFALPSTSSGDGDGSGEEAARAGDAGTSATRGGPRVKRIRWIEGVRPRTAGRLFGRVGWTVYGLAALFVLATLGAVPSVRPELSDLWFLSDPVLSVLVLLPMTMVLAGVHEAWHWLAGRAIGVPAVFRVSYRGVFMVFETDLTQVVTVPRHRRYGIFLAGVAINGVMMALALAVRVLHAYGVVGLPAAVDSLLGALVLVQLLGVGWQVGAVFFRNDGYAILANALRCHNLNRATWLTVKGRIARLNERERAELEGIGPHDRRVARWFALSYLPGFVVVGSMLSGWVVPFLITMARALVVNFGTLDVASAGFWASVAAALLLVATYGSPAVLALRERRLRRAGRLL